MWIRLEHLSDALLKVMASVIAKSVATTLTYSIQCCEAMMAEVIGLITKVRNIKSGPLQSDFVEKQFEHIVAEKYPCRGSAWFILG